MWKKVQPRLDPKRLVFIDETWAKTNMTRTRGWSRRGTPLIAKAPHGHWKTMTSLAALRCDAITAPFVLDGPIDGQSFLAYVEQVVAPTLKPGDIVVMDMYGRPRRSNKNLSTGAALGRVPTCIRPLMRRVSCRRPVWEFADQIQNNLARSWRSSMIWFFRSRLCDRWPIPSV